jgi:putative transposase
LRKDIKMSKPKNKLEEAIDEAIKGLKPGDITGEGGFMAQVTKAIMERALQGEMTHHLGYEKHDPAGRNKKNSRNGASKKTVKGEFGTVDISIPRDREGTFEPKIIEKNQTRFAGFDDRIISMYARGMTTRDIAEHLKEMYKVDVSHELISSVTDAVLEEVREWQNRTLDPQYPIVYLDAIRLPVRENGHVIRKAFYLAIGVKISGHKEVLGIWVENNEGAKFWYQIMTELKNRGVGEIFIAVVDGLKGLPEAINAVYPQTYVQQCIVHQIRTSVKFVSYKDRKEITKDLKPVYTAVNDEAAMKALDQFGAKWDDRYPMITKSWKANWNHLTFFLRFPPDIRRAIYTTNTIESMNYGLKKATKNRASFSNDDAAIKLLYLAILNLTKKWTMPIPNWGPAMHQFAILFDKNID